MDKSKKWNTFKIWINDNKLDDDSLLSFSSAVKVTMVAIDFNKLMLHEVFIIYFIIHYIFLDR